ncbi:MAG: HlyD family efflux transporter periplasmic adaptor subunit [Planctomycetota bacterium]
MSGWYPMHRGCPHFCIFRKTGSGLGGASRPGLGENQRMVLRLPSTMAFVLMLLLISTAAAFSQSTNNELIVINSAIVKQQKLIEIPAEQSGVLTKVAVKEGNTIQAGDLIAKTDDRIIQQQLIKSKLDHELAKKIASSTAEIEFAEKSRAMAISDLSRSTAANQRVANSIPQARVEKQELEVERTTLMLQKANHEFEIADFKTKISAHQIKASELHLTQTTTYANCQGLVVSVLKQQGEWIEKSEVICKVQPTEFIRLEGLIGVEEATKLTVGQRCIVDFDYRWLQQKQVEGRLLFINPNANPVNLKLPVWVEIPNGPLRIPAGIRARIRFELEHPATAKNGYQN